MPQPVDVGRITAGFRGKMFRSDGSRWGQCSQWALSGTVTSTDEQPLGSAWPVAVAQSFAATLTVSEHVIVQVLDAGNGALPAPEDAPQRPPEAPQRAQDMSQQELRRGEGDIIDDLFRADQQGKQRMGTVVFERLKVRQFNGDGSPKHDDLGELVYGPLELRLRPLRQSEIDRERSR